MEENKYNKKIYFKHVIIFLLLIPYYIIVRLFVWIAILKFTGNLARSDILFIYMQSILFNLPIWFYVYWSVKSFRSRRFITGSVFSLILIILLYGYYFTGIHHANKVINETYQIYNGKHNSGGHNDEKIGFIDAYELYFAPWMIEKKINRRIEKWYNNPVREIIEEQEIEL